MIFHTHQIFSGLVVLATLSSATYIQAMARPPTASAEALRAGWKQPQGEGWATPTNVIQQPATACDSCESCNADATPLHLACRAGHINCVNIIIQRGARLDIKDIMGDTALHDACQKGHIECVRLLLEHGANPHATNLLGHTPLHRACRWGNVASVRLLLTKGANLRTTTIFGNTALKEAQENNRNDIVDAIFALQETAN